MKLGDAALLTVVAIIVLLGIGLAWWEIVLVFFGCGLLNGVHTAWAKA